MSLSTSIIFLIVCFTHCVFPVLANEESDISDIETIVYRPPLLGAPDARVGAATKSLFADPKQLKIIAPRDHIGHTISSSPTLYWYQQKPSNQVKFFLYKNGETIFKTELKVKLSGLQTLNFLDHEVHFTEQGLYCFYLESVNAQFNAEYADSNCIYYALNENPTSAENNESDLDKIKILAKKGVWYDAYHLLHEQDELNTSIQNTYIKLLHLTIKLEWLNEKLYND